MDNNLEPGGKMISQSWPKSILFLLPIVLKQLDFAKHHCQDKKAYKHKREAILKINRTGKYMTHSVHVYKCLYCSGFHIGRKKANNIENDRY